MMCPIIAKYIPETVIRAAGPQTTTPYMELIGAIKITNRQAKP